MSKITEEKISEHIKLLRKSFEDIAATITILWINKADRHFQASYFNFNKKDRLQVLKEDLNDLIQTQKKVDSFRLTLEKRFVDYSSLILLEELEYKKLGVFPNGLKTENNEEEIELLNIATLQINHTHKMCRKNENKILLYLTDTNRKTTEDNTEPSIWYYCAYQTEYYGQKLNKFIKNLKNFNKWVYRLWNNKLYIDIKDPKKREEKVIKHILNPPLPVDFLPWITSRDF